MTREAEHPAMPGESNSDVVNAIYAAFGRGDLPGIFERLADDVVFRVPSHPLIPFSGTFDGRAAVGRFFSAIADCAEFSRFEPYEFVAQSDLVLVFGRETARSRVSGRAWSAEWLHAWRLREGRVVGFQEFTDTAAIAAAFDGERRTPDR